MLSTLTFFREYFCTRPKEYLLCLLREETSPMRYFRHFQSGSLEPYDKHIQSHLEQLSKSTSPIDKKRLHHAQQLLLSTGNFSTSCSLDNEPDVPFSGCEFITFCGKKVNITDFAPSYKRIEHYGAMIASVAKGHSICGVIEIFSDHPSVRKYPLPSHQTLYRWVVLFSRLFREEIKEKVRGKHVTLTTDEWSALLSSSIIGKVLIFLYKFLSFCNFLFFFPFTLTFKLHDLSLF